MSLIRSNIWLGDGNIVIQADGVQFKVHQGYLARLSTIFSDVFSMPQPTGGLSPRSTDATFSISKIPRKTSLSCFQKYTIGESRCDMALTWITDPHSFTGRTVQRRVFASATSSL